MALNETLTEGGDILNGAMITNKMWEEKLLMLFSAEINNYQLQVEQDLPRWVTMWLDSDLLFWLLYLFIISGITGVVRWVLKRNVVIARFMTFFFRIDGNGDRDADYALLDLDPVTGRFEVVYHYYGSTRYEAISLTRCLLDIATRDISYKKFSFPKLHFRRSLVPVPNKRESRDTFAQRNFSLTNWINSQRFIGLASMTTHRKTFPTVAFLETTRSAKATVNKNYVHLSKALGGRNEAY